MKEKLSVFRWGVALAWKIDKRMLLFWVMLSSVLAMFPALILAGYREAVGVLSAFLAQGMGSFGDIAGPILFLGCFIVISGLSARLNQDFLYVTMYDSFYLGLEEVVMEASQKIDLTELAKKETVDEFFAAHSRCGALTDLTSAGCALLRCLMSSASILLVAWTVSPLVGTAAAAYVALVLWVNVSMAERCRVVFQELDRKQRKANYIKSLVQEGDTSKEVRIFGNLEWLKEDWRKAMGEAEGMRLGRVAGFARINLVCRVGFYGFLGTVMGFSLTQVAIGAMGPEVLLMLFTLGINLSEAVEEIPVCYQRLDYGLYGLGLQKGFLERTPLIDEKEEMAKADTPADEEVCFRADHLNFSYPGGKPVLQDVTFQIRKGETVALVGVNGSGKTTLLKLLMGLYRAELGSLKFQGREPGEYRHTYIRSKISTFFQDFFLFHMTVKENVGLGNIDCMEDQKMVRDALVKGGVADLVDSWDRGVDQILLKEVYTDGVILSGGQGQRMAVARTHISDKEILIFDEPASMLDPVAELEQFNHIREKLEGHTAILVSHRIGFARLADRILVLNEGCLEESGTHQELMEKDGLYARLFHEQAQWYDTAQPGRGGLA